MTPFKIGAADETSPQWLIEDEQRARALELEAAGEHRRAIRVLQCARADANRLFACNDRLCPRCAAVKASHYRRRIDAVVREMKSTPVFLTFTLPVPLSWGPGRAAKLLRSALQKLRRRVCSRCATSGCGVIEPKLSNDGSLWAVHAHLLLDAQGLDVSALETDWRSLTDGRGRVRVARRGLHAVNTSAACRYITKTADWSPLPGAIPLSAFILLAGRERGLHGHQLLIAWGAGTRRGTTRGSSRARLGARAVPRASQFPRDHVVATASTRPASEVRDQEILRRLAQRALAAHRRVDDAIDHDEAGWRPSNLRAGPHLRVIDGDDHAHP